MNKRFFVLTCCLTVLFFSCDKKDEASVKRTSNPIIASGYLEIYKDFSPDSIIKPFEKCTTVGTQTACGMVSGNLDLDLNNDDKIDIIIQGYLGTNMADLNEKSAIVKIIDSTFQIISTPLMTNDTISNKSKWSNSKILYLAKKSGSYGLQEDYNSWTDTRFFGFRKISLNDTLFGWIKLSIKDYNNLSIDSYLIQAI